MRPLHRKEGKVIAQVCGRSVELQWSTMDSDFVTMCTRGLSGEYIVHWRTGRVFETRLEYTAIPGLSRRDLRALMPMLFMPWDELLVLARTRRLTARTLTSLQAHARGRECDMVCMFHVDPGRSCLALEARMVYGGPVPLWRFGRNTMTFTDSLEKALDLLDYGRSWRWVAWRTRAHNVHYMVRYTRDRAELRTSIAEAFDCLAEDVYVPELEVLYDGDA
jgi:hypothetical protein